MQRNNITEILNKFENSYKLYEINPIFNNVINQLSLGGDVYQVISELILVIEKVQKYNEFLLNFISF